MSQTQDKLKAAGAVIYAISNEAAKDLTAMQEREKLGSGFVFLSDKGAKAADRYMGHYADNGVLKPGTFVIGAGGKILYAYVDEDYKVRAATQSVVDAVLRAKKEIAQNKKPK